MSVLYTASATVVGGREGHVRTSDGLHDLDLAPPKELGGKGNATNPEQLFASGYAACFESAMRHIARVKKIRLTGASVTAQVSLMAVTDISFWPQFEAKNGRRRHKVSIEAGRAWLR